MAGTAIMASITINFFNKKVLAGNALMPVIFYLALKNNLQ